MAIRSDATHWGSLAKFFHWAVVLLILAQGIVGLVMVELPRRPNVIAVYSFHKSLGLTILALAVLRLGWRLFDRRPDEPPTVPRWQAIAARLGHALLYVLLFALPLSEFKPTRLEKRLSWPSPASVTLVWKSSDTPS